MTTSENGASVPIKGPSKAIWPLACSSIYRGYHWGWNKCCLPGSVTAACRTQTPEAPDATYLCTDEGGRLICGEDIQPFTSFFFIAILNSSIIWGITIIKMWFWTVMQNFTLRQNSNYSTSSKLKPKLTSEKCLLTCCEGISFLPGVPSHTTGLRSAWMANGNDSFVYLSFACPYTIKMGHQNSHIVEWCCFHVSSC